MLSPFVQFDLAWKEIFSRLGPALSSDFSWRGWTLCENGTSALYRVFKHIKSVQNEKKAVVLPAYTCPTVAVAANRAGFSIHLVDHDYPRFDFSDGLAEALQDPRTSAVVVTHLFGTVSDLNRVKRMTEGKGIFVIEDAAQVFREETEGGVTGEQGDFGIYSLSPSKPLSLVSGGILWTRDEIQGEFELVPPTPASGVRDLVLQMAYKLGTRSYLYPLASARPEMCK